MHVCVLLPSGLGESGFRTFPVFLTWTLLLEEAHKEDKDAIRNVSSEGFVAMMDLAAPLLFRDAVRLFFFKS